MATSGHPVELGAATIGYKQNGFIFYGRWLVDKECVGEWPYADAGVVRRLLAPFAGEAFLARVDQISIWAADAQPLESLAALDALVKPADGTIFVLFGGWEDDPEVRIHISISRAGAEIALGMAPEVLPAKVRERIATWIQAWNGSLGEVRCRLQSAELARHGWNYPRPRPPHIHSTWHVGALDLYLGRSWHEQNGEARAVLAKIEAAPLPSSARRTSEGDVLRIAFGADPQVALDDADAIGATRRAQEDWLTPLIPAEREIGWNALGDRIAAVVRPAAMEPFTFYDPRYSVGYKAMIVDPETGEIDEAMWAQLAKIAKARKLPDGTEVKGVRLIFPVRENALQMHARAIADGFEMSTYPGNPRVFWEVNPP